MRRHYNVLFFEDIENSVRLMRMRRTLRDASDPLSLPTKSFIQRFRLSKEAFVLVLETLNLRSGSRSTYIPPILRLGATLEVLAGGGYQWLTGNDFGISVGQSTLSEIVCETVKALEPKLCPIWITWDMGNEIGKEETKLWFFQKYAIPGIVGCVDGTHLYLQRPRENEEIFFNRKGRHSLNAMIICDHKMRITAINAKYAGSAHDSLVWKHSNERAFFVRSFNEQNHNDWLLGDSGYPLEPWLLTPYRASNDQAKLLFNSIHSKARNIIERCIGIYKGRWRILMEERKSRYHPLKVAMFANVCAALHNICIFHNVDNNIADTQSSDDHFLENATENIPISNNYMKEFAERIRNSIKDSLFE